MNDEKVVMDFGIQAVEQLAERLGEMTPEQAAYAAKRVLLLARTRNIGFYGAVQAAVWEPVHYVSPPVALGFSAQDEPGAYYPVSLGPTEHIPWQEFFR